MPHIPFVIASPSGAGKTTIASLLLDGDHNLQKTVSCTTRKPRTGEEPGQAYDFLSKDEFKGLIEKGEFIEWAEVYGDFYGSRLSTVNSVLEKNDALLVLDLEGAKNLKSVIKQTCIILLVPPQMSDLEARLKRRGTDTKEVMERRLKQAPGEIAEGLKIADFVVVNGDLAQALSDVLSIIRACRIKNLDRGGLARGLGL